MPLPFFRVQTTMHFHNHLCWYLDNTFCGSLHATYSTGFDVQTFMTILCFGITAIGLVMLGKHIMQALLNVSKHIRQHKNGMKKWHWWDVLEVHTQRVPPWCAHPSSRLGCSLLGDTGYLDPARRLPLTQQADAAHGHHRSGDLVGCDQSVRPGPHFPNVGCSSTSAAPRVAVQMLRVLRL